VEQRDLGKTGLKVSALGYGAGSVGGLMVRGDPAEQTRAVARALDAGITYFDTAPGYGDGRSEENLGRALRDLGAWNRVVVGTKVRLTAADLRDPAGSIRRSCLQSLQRLGRGAVDLLQFHNQVVLGQPDGGSGISLGYLLGEVAEGLQRLVRDGLADHVGFTGLGDPGALHEAALAGRYETVQCYFNALNPSAGFAGASGGGRDFAGLIDAAAGAGLGVIVIRALAAGALAAQPARHPNAGDPGAPIVAGADYARDLERARALAPLAQELGLESPLELALRFVLSKRGVSTALVGYSDLAQLEDAIRWAERGPLPQEAVRRVVEGLRGA
jgi:aryl-alcohol dehydrogenase-like predicted oxidoreductase